MLNLIYKMFMVKRKCYRCDTTYYDCRMCKRTYYCPKCTEVHNKKRQLFVDNYWKDLNSKDDKY